MSTKEITELRTCRNQGCGKNFTQKENTSESCRYHSKPPYFHDAAKIWPCCDKKSYNFSDFLEIPGCTVSYHNETPNADLLYDVANKLKPTQESIAIQNELLKKYVVNEQPLSIHRREPFAIESPLNVKIKVEPSSSLVEEIKKFKPSASTLTTSTDTPNNNEIPSIDPNNIPFGTKCRRNGCDKIYKNKMDLHDECVFHEGVPIFHDGSKYWSCCRIKKSDFNEFLRQKGCSIGSHDFVSPIKSLISSCRFDFYQQGDQITLTFYAKMIDYTECYIVCDPYHVNPQINKPLLTFLHKIIVEFPYQPDRKFFSKTIELFSEIYPDKTYATVTPFKLEIKLSVVDGNKTWAAIEYQPPEVKQI